MMQNPFMVGDLVHIPCGTLFFKATGTDVLISINISYEKPLKTIIVDNNRLPYYGVLVDGATCYVHKEDIALVA